MAQNFGNKLDNCNKLALTKAKVHISNNTYIYKRALYPSQLCIILTERCNIRCRHCLCECSPSRHKSLKSDIIESFIRQAAESKLVNSIGFSGGEPFLDMSRLERVIGLCREFGMESTVTTNGFWASNVREARKVLGRLKGLRNLCLSTDTFHQEFLPIRRIINALIASRELGINCIVYVTYLNDPVREVDTINQQLKNVKGFYTIQQQPVSHVGRASKELYAESTTLYDPSTTLCMSADVPTLNVNGDITACCGPSGHWPGDHLLRLANMREQTLKKTLEAADQDPVIQALRVWGPAKLLKLVLSQAKKEGHPLSAPPTKDICSICEYLFANPHRAALIQRAIGHNQTRRKIAVARMAQLGEVSMFLRLNCENDSVETYA